MIHYFNRYTGHVIIRDIDGDAVMLCVSGQCKLASAMPIAIARAERSPTSMPKKLSLFELQILKQYAIKLPLKAI